MSNIKQAIQSFLFHCRYEKNLSSKTLEAYQSDLNQFLTFLEPKPEVGKLSDIDKVILRGYLRELSRWKPKTIKRKIACLKAMFNYLEFEDQIAINPFRKMRIRIKEPRNLPVVMEKSEVKKLLLSAYRAKEKIESESYSYEEVVRDIAVLELLFSTGIRVSELCSLRPESIELKIGLVKVHGKGNKERVIQIFDREVKEALLQYKKVFSTRINKVGFFFINRLGNPLSDQSVRNMIRKYANHARLSKHITPHTFRHTFATLLLEEDVDIKYIQHFLGHSSIMTTQIYTHVNKRKQGKILKAKHPRQQFQLG